MLGARRRRGGPGAAVPATSTISISISAAPAAPPAPQADHFIPTGLNAGPSLRSSRPNRPSRPTRPYQAPSYGDGPANGRIPSISAAASMCARASPVEIDLSRLCPRPGAPRHGALAIRPMTPPNEAKRHLRRMAEPALAHDHSGQWLADRRAPDRGQLQPGHQFHPRPGPGFPRADPDTSNSRGPSGAVPVAWRPCQRPGYFLMAVGSRGDNTIVMWSSSEIQMSQMGAFDYLAPAEVQRLLRSGSCCSRPPPSAPYRPNSPGVQARVPDDDRLRPRGEFRVAGPAAAPRTWPPDWTVSCAPARPYVGMLGQDMEAMMRGEGREPQGSSARSRAAAARRPRRPAGPGRRAAARRAERFGAGYGRAHPAPAILIKYLASACVRAYAAGRHRRLLSKIGTKAGS